MRTNDLVCKKVCATPGESLGISVPLEQGECQYFWIAKAAIQFDVQLMIHKSLKYPKPKTVSASFNFTRYRNIQQMGQ